MHKNGHYTVRKFVLLLSKGRRRRSRKRRRRTKREWKTKREKGREGRQEDEERGG
jgi:hypothetical protein